jgi:hypothetical protein
MEELIYSASRGIRSIKNDLLWAKCLAPIRPFIGSIC